jgi:hypothetical protein
VERVLYVRLNLKMKWMEFNWFVTNEKHLLKAATSNQKYTFKGLQQQQQQHQR